jgi:hypothetical protein
MDVPGLNHLGIFANLDEEIEPRLGNVFERLMPLRSKRTSISNARRAPQDVTDQL